MTEKIKRSLAVHPCPIIIDGARIRFPTHAERYSDGNLSAEWTGFWGYRISRVTNSVELHPGIALTKSRVEELINDGWTVTVLSKR
jgi:hypothetical protein